MDGIVNGMWRRNEISESGLAVLQFLVLATENGEGLKL